MLYFSSKGKEFHIKSVLCFCLFLWITGIHFGEQKDSGLNLKQWIQELIQAQKLAKETGTVEPLRGFVTPEYLDYYVSYNESLRDIAETHQEAIKVYPIRNTYEFISAKVLNWEKEEDTILALVRWRSSFEADYISASFVPSKIRNGGDNENIVSLKKMTDKNYALECSCWMVTPFHHRPQRHKKNWERIYRDICKNHEEMARKVKAVARPYERSEDALKMFKDAREENQRSGEFDELFDSIRERFLKQNYPGWTPENPPENPQGNSGQ